ncbi:hypothetical protein V495_06386, partial [Pseudogymnoascus sp. VKM F-4514 (FW-929)]
EGVDGGGGDDLWVGSEGVVEGRCADSWQIPRAPTPYCPIRPRPRYGRRRGRNGVHLNLRMNQIPELAPCPPVVAALATASSPAVTPPPVTAITLTVTATLVTACFSFSVAASSAEISSWNSAVALTVTATLVAACFSISVAASVAELRSSAAYSWDVATLATGEAY